MTLHSSFGIASSALDVQSVRMKIHANNIANLNTPNYVRKIPVLVEHSTMGFEDVMATMRNGGVVNAGLSYSPGGVSMPGIIGDNAPAKKMYMPGHPEADKDGYVTMSNSNVLADMADAMNTSRLYEANLAVVGIVKAMSNKALEIGRGG